ncbi:PA3496 family putative envelope integrity protein [Gynuella sp.]|uniref:PA3496 family putative envelope integrity protein n=2 Tax=Gynuella TaxID=1445504 RepID=UPI003D0ADF47
MNSDWFLHLGKQGVKRMSVNLFEFELANLEDDALHRPTESSSTKRVNNQRKLAARRAIEDHLEQRRLRSETGEIDLDLY